MRTRAGSSYVRLAAFQSSSRQSETSSSRLRFGSDLLKTLAGGVDAEQCHGERAGHEDDGGDGEHATESNAGERVADHDRRGQTADSPERGGDSHAGRPE